MREHLSQLQPTNDNGHRGLEVAVAERSDFPGAWGVEAVDTIGDGSIYQSLFLGPRAKERAYAYACLVYGVGLP